MPQNLNQNLGPNTPFTVILQDDGGVTPRFAASFGGSAGTPSSDVATVQGANNGTPVGVVGKLRTVQNQITLNATPAAYTAGDVVSPAGAATVQTFTNALRVSGGNAWLVGARLVTNKKSITPRFRVHLFNASPTAANIAADNLPYKALYADMGLRLGSFELPAMTTPADVTNSNISSSFDLGLRVPLVGADANIYALLEVLDAFTPDASQLVTLVLTFDQN